MNIELPQVPPNIPVKKNRFSRGLGKFVLKLFGWRIIGNFPNEKKLVAAIAPHTSNWDFVIAVAAMLALNLRVSFLGKDSLFKGPLGYFMRSIGGIPVDRSASHGVVGQMVNEFEYKDSLLFALAPEGTRSKTTHWKTGFLHIAHQANVPIVPVCLDFKNKAIHFKTAHHVGSDIDAALAAFKAEFPASCAKNPQNI